MENVEEGDAPAQEAIGVVEAEGNLTQGDLAAKLLARRTGDPAEQVEEEPQSAEQPAEEPETETSPDAEDTPDPQAEESATKADVETDVLSKYGINMDDLSPDEAEAIAKQLGSRAVKRFGKLTGQKKELQEKLDVLENHYERLKEETETAQKHPPQAQAKATPDGPLSHINTEDGLEEESGRINDLIDWIGDQLDNESQYDDDGNEFVAELNGKSYSKGELKTIRANARQSLRKDIPKRRNWIEQKTQYDGATAEKFNWLSDENSEKRAFFLESKQHPRYAQFVEGNPDGNFLLALLTEGWFATQVNQEKGRKSKSLPTGTPPQAATAQAAPRKQVAGRQTDIQKAIQTAELKFQQTGNQNDLTALRKLKAQARSAA